MREFSDIKRELQLKKFLDSPHGTLYFVPYGQGRPRIIVRHFDCQLPESLVASFASLTRATQAWLAEHSSLDRLARVAQPIEVGRDFIAREHFTYYTSTDSYQLDDEDEKPPEPPEEFAEIRSIFRSACNSVAGSPEAILEVVLARSLLEPTGKTFFNEREGRFIIVELKPTRDELERWPIVSGIEV